MAERYDIRYKATMSLDVEAIVEQFKEYLIEKISELAPFEDLDEIEIDEDCQATVVGKMSGCGELTHYTDMPDDFEHSAQEADFVKEVQYRLDKMKEFQPKLDLKKFINPDSISFDTEIEDMEPACDWGDW